MIIPDKKLKHFDGEIYQRDKLAVAMKYAPNTGTFIDCGAHVGTWSKEFAKKAHRVIAIEPNPTNFLCLQRNLVDINNIQLINAAVWSHSGEILKISQDNVSVSQCISEEGNEVKTICLDDLDATDVTFLKIDVEGCEYQLLTGAKNLIKTYRPIMYIELKDRCLRKYGSSKDKVMSLLTEWGYVKIDRIKDDYIYIARINDN